MTLGSVVSAAKNESGVTPRVRRRSHAPSTSSSEALKATCNDNPTGPIRVTRARVSPRPARRSRRARRRVPGTRARATDRRRPGRTPQTSQVAHREVSLEETADRNGAVALIVGTLAVATAAPLRGRRRARSRAARRGARLPFRAEPSPQPPRGEPAAAGLSGNASTIANEVVPVRRASHATVSGSPWTSGSASRRNDASSSSMPALASSRTIRPLVTIRRSFSVVHVPPSVPRRAVSALWAAQRHVDDRGRASPLCRHGRHEAGSVVVRAAREVVAFRRYLDDSYRSRSPST